MRSGRLLLLLIVLGMTAACGGGGGGSPIAVAPAKLLSISVTPANASISLGTGQQFVATGIYSDNSRYNLTTSVTWTSLNGSVATIDRKGRVVSASTGTTLISASTGSMTNSVVLTVTDPNILAVTVNGYLCSSATSYNYPNKPCVRVQICTPGSTTQCQMINDILLDTGSYGLRLFHQVVSVPLSQVTVTAGSLAECVQYGDGSSDWGPVQLADVILGGEPAVTVPIQIINQAYSSPPSGCRGARADTSPTQYAGAGFNGILGVGLFSQDCGTACENNANNGMYYSCKGLTCTGATALLQDQVQNPVVLLPADNNGVIVQLPSIGASGQVSVNGALVLGIGTQANNSSLSVTMYPASSNADFSTDFSGTTYTSFIDSGSNAFYFPGTMQQCGGWFCPPILVLLAATNRGYGGSPSGNVAFTIGDATALFSTKNNAFDCLGGYSPGVFDWGLPFFFGRDVFVGIEGATSPLGTGPYWAY
jgi:hypothetical protein